MKQKVRELLVNAKAAQHWQGSFENNVNNLMELVSKVDTDKHMQEAGELMDVYGRSGQKAAKGRKKKIADNTDKPFEFLVFRN